MTVFGRIKKAGNLLKSARTRSGLKKILTIEAPRYLAKKSKRFSKNHLLQIPYGPLNKGLKLNLEIPTQNVYNIEAELPQFDLIVCVHNALDDVKNCLESIVLHTHTKYRLIIVNDGSDEPTSQYLEDFKNKYSQVMIDRSIQAGGYTKAANRGLSHVESDFIVLLNSDTVVAPHWLTKLHACLSQSSDIGIVGPLSNAASWQSIPELKDTSGDWQINSLPSGLNPADINTILESVHKPQYPLVSVVNGFCFALKMDVLTQVGGFDEQSFPFGYGEENDFCIRASDAGFKLAICDNLYIFHAKSKSYTKSRRDVLSKQGNEALRRKHPIEKIHNLTSAISKSSALESVRVKMTTALALFSGERNIHPNILFLLPVRGGGGGAHSIIQEVSGLRALGINAKIAIKQQDTLSFCSIYEDAFLKQNVFVPFSNIKELKQIAAHFDVVVASIFTSVDMLADIIADNPLILPAYYVQDYEPLFFKEPCALKEQALNSYDKIENIVAFAKTDWIRSEVESKHKLKVNKVSPSIDHSIYYPPHPSLLEKNKTVISAMIRPKTPRRGPERTLRVLKALEQKYPEQVIVKIFGCKDIELSGMQTDFKFKNLGILERDDVADLLRESSIFLDLSDYQAFGRTGLEAMACQTAVIMTNEGGAYEYIKDKENAFLVNPTDEDETIRIASRLIENKGLRNQIINEGLKTALTYSISKAALSELKILQQKWLEHLLKFGLSQQQLPQTPSLDASFVHGFDQFKNDTSDLVSCHKSSLQELLQSTAQNQVLVFNTNDMLESDFKNLDSAGIFAKNATVAISGPAGVSNEHEKYFDLVIDPSIDQFYERSETKLPSKIKALIGLQDLTTLSWDHYKAVRRIQTGDPKNDPKTESQLDLYYHKALREALHVKRALLN